jgi:uncharacterized protein
MEKVKDPCLSICIYDENDICEGCRRTKTEAKTWWRLDEEAKRRVMDNVEKRSENPANDYGHYA